MYEAKAHSSTTQPLSAEAVCVLDFSCKVCRVLSISVYLTTFAGEHLVFRF